MAQEKAKDVAGCIFALLWLGMGFIQLFAIIDGLEEWTGLPTFLAVIGAVILAWIPIVGSIIGFCGALYVWEWHWLAATALFFGPMLIFVVPTILISILAALFGDR